MNESFLGMVHYSMRPFDIEVRSFDAGKPQSRASALKRGIPERKSKLHMACRPENMRDRGFRSLMTNVGRWTRRHVVRQVPDDFYEQRFRSELVAVGRSEPCHRHHAQWRVVARVPTSFLALVRQGGRMKSMIRSCMCKQEHRLVDAHRRMDLPKKREMETS